MNKKVSVSHTSSNAVQTVRVDKNIPKSAELSHTETCSVLWAIGNDRDAPL